MDKIKGQGEAPLFQALIDYDHMKTSRFHVPGHKGYLFPSSAKHYYDVIANLDVTELSGLDDLHGATGVILEAQKRAAKTFFAEHTYFLVNGSTVGNLALILSVLQKGDTILVQRNAHKSVFHALALAEANAVFIRPVLCPTLGVPIGITKEAVEEALLLHPKAKAIFLTAPNYYGQRLRNFQDIINYAHEHDLLLLVDEAHGAHFGQHSSLPRSAMQLGADGVVQSTHKMLSALTMSAMLHRQGSRIAQADLAYYLQVLQSSSPSYILMASLDLARQFVDSMTEEEWQRGIKLYTELATSLEELGYYVSRGSAEGNIGQLSIEQDPYKLVIQASFCSGYKLQELLEQEEGIRIEMADPLNIVLALPIIPNLDWNSRLLGALKKIRNMKLFDEATISTRTDKIACKEATLEAIQMCIIKEDEQEEVVLEDAVGRRAAEAIIPYPPGIPLCFVNQVVTVEHIEQIRQLEAAGAKIQGKSAQVKTLKVKKLT